MPPDAFAHDGTGQVKLSIARLYRELHIKTIFNAKIVEITEQGVFYKNVGSVPNEKAEFECFEIGDIHYLNRLIQSRYTDLNNGPHLIQFVFTFGSNWPTSQFLSTAVNAVPRGCLLGIIAPGAMQFPVLAMALVQGLHVNVGMEDNVYIDRGKKAESNAQLVEKIVRIAKELGRKVATPAQAR